MSIPTGRRLQILGALQVVGVPISAGIGIKSVQENASIGGIGVLTSAKTIGTAVDVSNSLIISRGNWISGSDLGAASANLELTDATTVTWTRLVHSNLTITVNFTVIEFLPGVLKSKQTGIVNITGTNQSAVDTITAVGANAIIFSAGFASDAANAREALPRLALTAPTIVTATRGQSPLTSLVDAAYTVIEFN